MAKLRVKVGKCYVYDPVLWDVADPPPGKPKRGDILCVTRLRGVPPPGTMGMVHVTDRRGNLVGLVFQNSLRPLPKARSKYASPAAEQAPERPVSRAAQRWAEKWDLPQ